MRDLYEVLGVPRGASASEIKRAYRDLAKQHHPDHNPGDAKAEERFKEAANAYQVLSDAEQRERYDRFGFDGLRGGGGGGASGFSNVEDIFSAFGDMFGDFFGRGRGGGQRQARGADLQVALRLTFAEAVWGVTKDVKVTRQVACGTCDGSGAKPGSKPEVCSGCAGKGQVVHAQGFFMVQSTCPRCRGAGKTIKDPCGDCGGRGSRGEAATLSVTVPAGVDDGQTLRLAGKGEPAPAGSGGPAGHLYVQLAVTGDERFQREGDDVITEVPISFIKAAMGGELEVPSLDDNCQGTAVIDIKPGTQPGHVLVRRGQGIPRVNGGGRGDHAYALRVEIPEKLSARAAELMRELAEELGDGASAPARKGLFGRSKRNTK